MGTFRYLLLLFNSYPVPGRLLKAIYLFLLLDCNLSKRARNKFYPFILCLNSFFVYLSNRYGTGTVFHSVLVSVLDAYHWITDPDPALFFIGI
jgi:hypothetical protein